MSQRAGVPRSTRAGRIWRGYDFWLGGKDNYPADRAVAERVAATGLRGPASGRYPAG